MFLDLEWKHGNLSRNDERLYRSDQAANALICAKGAMLVSHGLPLIVVYALYRTIPRLAPCFHSYLSFQHETYFRMCLSANILPSTRPSFSTLPLSPSQCEHHIPIFVTKPLVVTNIIIWRCNSPAKFKIENQMFLFSLQYLFSLKYTVWITNHMDIMFKTICKR